VYSTERTLGEQGAKLAEADRKAIEEALGEAKEALKGEDVDRIKQAQDKLMRASHKLAEILYREAQTKTPGSGTAAPEGGPAGKPKEGEVVDADFEDLGEKK
jgi:molecular chaperone DnaK